MKPMSRKEWLAASASTRIITPDPSRSRRKDSEEISAEDLAKQMGQITKSLKERDDSIKSSIEKMKEEVKATGEASKETVAKLEKQAETATELQARLQEIEQKFGSLKVNMKAERPASIGQQFVDNEKFKSWNEDRSTPKFRMGFKDITSLTSGTGGAGDLVQEMRVPGIIRPEDRPMTIRQLLSVGRTASNLVEYILETGFYNNAAPVPEGTLKPQSSLEFTVESAPVRTIAHWMRATKQILADAPMLASYIDNRLRYGLMFEEEEQLLAGDGTGENLLGLIPQATDFDPSRNRPSDTRIDLIRRAMTQTRLAEYRADAVVLHPEDWEEIELTKTDDAAYVWGNPRGLLGPSIWGLPVIETTAVEPGEFLVGAFRLAASIWDREDASVTISLEDQDNFVRNMVTMLAEKRLALTVFRPEALVFGDFSEFVSG